MLRLYLKETRKGTKKYALALWFRIVCICFCLLMLYGAFISITEGTVTSMIIIPSILFLMSLFGACYRETWEFDREKATVTSVFGFACFVKKETFSFSDIVQIQLIHFVRGDHEESGYTVKPNKRRNMVMMKFSLLLVSEQRKDIEIIPERKSAGSVERSVQSIAAYTGLPLFVDRGPEHQVSMHNVNRFR